MLLDIPGPPHVLSTNPALPNRRRGASRHWHQNDIRRIRLFLKEAKVSAILVEADSARGWRIIFTRLDL